MACQGDARVMGRTRPMGRGKNSVQIEARIIAIDNRAEPCAKLEATGTLPLQPFFPKDNPPLRKPWSDRND